VSLFSSIRRFVKGFKETNPRPPSSNAQPVRRRRAPAILRASAVAFTLSTAGVLTTATQISASGTAERLIFPVLFVLCTFTLVAFLQGMLSLRSSGLKGAIDLIAWAICTLLVIFACAFVLTQFVGLGPAR